MLKQRNMCSCSNRLHNVSIITSAFRTAYRRMPYGRGDGGGDNKICVYVKCARHISVYNCDNAVVFIQRLCALMCRRGIASELLYVFMLGLSMEEDVAEVTTSI